jgi:hypothetical protein
MPEQVHIRRGVAEAVCNDTGRESFDKGGPERLVSSLPVVLGVEEEGIISHAFLIFGDVEHVK